jgi:putative peptidoglycan lipid II flippase
MSSVKDISIARATIAEHRLSPVRILIAAAIFHLAVTTTIYGLGRYALLPGTFDQHGTAVSFAYDGIQNRADAAELSGALVRGEVLDWLTGPYPLHVKLYSICFLLFGPWLGFNIIGAEPLNALFYLATLALVFHLGRETFTRRSGLLAAGMVALWPSFLIHTTQLLRDPLFVVGMLAFLLISLRWLTRSYTWSGALLAGASGGLIAAVLWVARNSMGGILIAVVLLGAGLLIARQLGGGRIRRANLAGMALMIAMTIGAQQVIPKNREPVALKVPIAAAIRQERPPPSEAEADTPAPSNAAPKRAASSAIVARVMRWRSRFIIMYPQAGSNIDSQVQFTGMADLIRYLPRAALIGFFAPFPNMWLATGQRTGSAGRRLGGLETLAMYAVEGLAVLGVWRGRRRLPVWFLLFSAATGLIALGLVMVNVGALFRLRYVFLMPIIILGAEGALSLFGRLSKRRAKAEELRASA